MNQEAGCRLHLVSVVDSDFDFVWVDLFKQKCDLGCFSCPLVNPVLLASQQSSFKLKLIVVHNYFFQFRILRLHFEPP